MRYGQHPLYMLNLLLLCLSAGILLDDALRFPPLPFIIAAVLLLPSILYAAFQKSKYTFLLLGLLFLSVGYCRYSFFTAVPPDNIIHSAGQTKSVTGILQDQPVILKNSDGLTHIRYELSALSAKGMPVSGGYYLYTRQKNPINAQAGDKITASGKIHKISSYKNPGRINNTLQANLNGIYAYVAAGKNPVSVEPQPDSMRLLKKIGQLRFSIKAAMEQVMPAADAAAVFAMLFGGYNGIDPDLLDAFTVTGIVHILSVSGSHITLLAGTIISIGRFFRLRRKYTVLLLMICIGSYAVFCGLVPPVIRAAAMGILSYMAFALGRESQSRYLLSLIGIFMLIISPGLLLNISFQLSFAATAGLLYTSSFFQKRLAFLPRFFAVSLSITLGAQFFCLPFLSWYFHSISLSSLIANIFAVPLVDMIIVAALSAVFLNLLLPFFASIIFVLCSLLLGLVHEITRLLAQLPGSMLYLPYLTISGSIFYYICWFIILNDRLYKLCREYFIRHHTVYTVFLCLFLTALLYNNFREHDLSVHFIDVGQGDAALIITPHGRAVMIDTGGIRDSDYDVGKNVDVPYLYHYGITRLDGIFLSHAHADHAGGLYGITKQMPVSKIFIGHEKNSEYASVWHISPQSDIMNKTVVMNENQTFTLDGVKFIVLYAPPAANTDDTNETSVIIKVLYKNFNVLFTGDLPAQRETELLKKAGRDINCTVLKVAHHGSKTSSSEEFLAAARPRWAVISVGAENSYGHPDKNVLDRLSNVKASVFRTDQNGAVVFYTDGTKCTIEPYIE
ncbi:DNA internalization-related competence protein ComEC/Rec2 [Pectinatus haikarae]|uniref:DNA internalization-related competence protein ComEC/Rec2 n=1 Tax=Pectinatus haikarae TaxID=349096 RepID=UPI0018C5B992|nr:DNA internalization-related competence protein ComEC/Rec2 [Pectinatus haikarae]